MTVANEAGAARWLGWRLLAAALGVLLLLRAATLIVGAAPGRIDLLTVCAAAFCTVASAYLWWFALRGNRHESRRWMWAGIRPGLMVGAIGLVLGTIGPMILAPDANQGPLLGCLVAFPVGVLLGTVIGLILYSRRRKRATTAPVPKNMTTPAP